MSKLSAYPLYAFLSLESHLNGVTKSLTLAQIKTKLGWDHEDEASPLFITWNIFNKRGVKELRGCIGTFSPLPVEEGIADYALVAGLEDHRFSPISKVDLPRLSVSVTLLQHFEEVDDPLNWELGKHGIRIKFVKSGRSYGATFLPDVAPEQGWDKMETLNHLVSKAGYHSNIDIDEIKVTRYQGLKTKANYEEYVEFMKSI